MSGGIQIEIRQSPPRSASQFQGRDDEILMLINGVEQKGRDLKKSLKDIDDKNQQSVQKMKKFQHALEHMAKAHDVMSASETLTLSKVANLEKDLQQARRALQEALGRKPQKIQGRDNSNEVRELKRKVQVLTRALQSIEDDRNKLDESVNDNEQIQAASSHVQDKFPKGLDDQTSASIDPQMNATAVNHLVREASDENNVVWLENKIKDLDAEMGQLRSSCGENTSPAQKKILVKHLKSILSKKARLQEKLSLLTAKQSKTARTHENSLEELQRRQEEDMRTLEQMQREREKRLAEIGKAVDTLHHSRIDPSCSDASLAVERSEQPQMGRVIRVPIQEEGVPQEARDLKERRKGRIFEAPIQEERVVHEARDLKQRRKGRVFQVPIQEEGIANEAGDLKERRKGRAFEVPIQEGGLAQSSGDLTPKTTVTLIVNPPGEGSEQFKKSFEIQDVSAANMPDGINLDINLLKEGKCLQEERQRNECDKSGRMTNGVPATAVNGHAKKRIPKGKGRRVPIEEKEVGRLVPIQDRELEQQRNSCVPSTCGQVCNLQETTAVEVPIQEVTCSVEQIEPRICTHDPTSIANKLKREMSIIQANLTSATGENQRLHMERSSFERTLSQAALELEQSRKDKAILQECLARALDELDQRQKEKTLLQESMPWVSDKLEQLKRAKCLRENLIQATNGPQQVQVHHVTPQVQEANSSHLNGQLLQERTADGPQQVPVHHVTPPGHEANSSQLSDPLVQEVTLPKNGVITFHPDCLESGDKPSEGEKIPVIQKEARDDSRTTKDAACGELSVNSAWTIGNLHSKCDGREESLHIAHTVKVRNAEDPIWDRVGELEMALTQAHANYNTLSQEIKRVRRERRSSTESLRTPAFDAAKKQHKSVQRGLPKYCKMTRECDKMEECTCLGERVHDILAAATVQPSYSLEYTNLKVSGSGNQQPALVRNISVCTSPRPKTPQRIIPISVPSTPVPITVAPDFPREPFVESPRSPPPEKERYFPSHGPMRVRRGLPSSPPRGMTTF